MVILLFFIPVLLYGPISKQTNLSSTPRFAVGSHQTAGSLPAPRGISPLAWVSRNRPHCLRRITSSEQTSLVRFRLKAKNSLALSLLLFPQSRSTLREPFTTLQRSDIRLDGSIIVPAAGHGHIGSHPILAADCFSLLAGKNKPKTLSLDLVVSRCFLPANLRAVAAWALAFAKTVGMCLMNGYAVFKVPGEAIKEPLTLFAVG